jgi:hypothetical protein
MKAQPERKWNLVKAGILAGFGLALAGLAVALPTPTESLVDREAVAGAQGYSYGMVAATQAEDEALFVDGPREAVAATSGSRDPSLAGLRVSPDAPDMAPIETF